MAEQTKIAWTDSTFNGWIGCTKVSALCDNCYAERDNKLHKWNGGLWGPGAPRKLTSVSYWQQPFRWDRAAHRMGQRRRVFAFSLADVFDAEGPKWPADRALPGELALKEEGAAAIDIFFHCVVRRTPNLDWLILTKRFERAREYLNHLWTPESPWPNVWILFSAGTQETLDHAMREMRGISAVVRGISAEPLLGPVDFRAALPWLNWLIVGGESGPHARQMRPDWEAAARDQARAARVPYYLKQLGQHWCGQRSAHKWDDPERWPIDMQVRQFPRPKAWDESFALK